MTRLRRSAVAFVLITAALILTAPLRERLARVAESSVLYRNLSPFVWLFDGQPMSATYIPTPIKSIQAVSVTLNNQTSNTSSALSPAITPANAILVYDGFLSNGAATGTSAYIQARGTITSSTVVTVNQGATNAGVIGTWKGTVTEYIGQFVKSSNCYAIAVADNSVTGTQSITAVDTTKTLVAYTGSSNVVVGNVEPFSQFFTVALTSSTVITATKSAQPPTSVTTASIGACYLEFR